MLEYCWLVALLLISARYFTGIEGYWTPLPLILPPSSGLYILLLNNNTYTYAHNNLTLSELVPSLMQALMGQTCTFPSLNCNCHMYNI